MRNVPRYAAFLALIILALPVVAADEKPAGKGKTPNWKKDMEGHQNSAKTVAAGVVTGKIVAIVEGKKSIRLQVQIPTLNPGAMQSMMQAQYNLARANSPQALFNAQRQMMQAQAQMYRYQAKDYELQAIDDVKVRLAQPPAQFDDKGRVKKYTAKELKELKGDDPKLPGYQGEFGDLKQDQVVQVTLVKKKDAPRVPAKKTKDAEVDLLQDHLPEVSMILVISEPKPTP
jgi:hypothetical protein